MQNELALRRAADRSLTPLERSDYGIRLTKRCDGDEIGSEATDVAGKQRPNGSRMDSTQFTLCI